jgi:hypothetical protein
VVKRGDKKIMVELELINKENYKKIISKKDWNKKEEEEIERLIKKIKEKKYKIKIKGKEKDK